MNSATTPLISIITVVYNGEAHLQETIDSIRQQNYENFEYIIIDGGSTDKSLAIIMENSDVVSFYISEKDDGISDAFNKGISKAKGDIIGILNSDDIYELNTLNIIAESYRANSFKDGVYYGNIRYFNNDISFELFPEINRIWKYMSLFHPAIFVSRKVYEQVGVFSLEYKYAMDCELIHRFLKHDVPFIYIDKVLTSFRLEGASDLNYKKSYKEFYRSVKAHGNYPYAYFYYLLGITKKRILKSGIGPFLKEYRILFSPFIFGKYNKK